MCVCVCVRAHTPQAATAATRVSRRLPLTLLPLPHPSLSLFAPTQRLQAVKGLSEAKAEKLVEAARKLCDAGAWMTGSDCLVKVFLC